MSFDLITIGKALQAAREEKGLTVQGVAEALFIRKRIIEAIEGGQWDALPHEVYVRGYITQYATFLGINEHIHAELTLPQNNTCAPEPVKSIRSHQPAGLGWRPSRRIAGMVAVAVIACGFLVYQNMDKHVFVAPPVQQQVNDQQPAVETQPAQAGYQTVATNAYADDGQGEKAALEGKKLMIACQQRTWVRIVIDGLEKKEFMMNPEEVLVLDGKEGFDLLIGNAGGIKLFYNGKDTGFAGDEGEVKRISLS